ncbi:hypothetical protein [Hoylesella shahii]|jgi:hypothetical protein|uniref:hypothetical protein n=1 Tax=Hoylesella shahii TaxID=228603 RepID=UPI00204936F2|nr:hypothetical protein [Hoylesella shahii]DAV47231.1 MAG TPA: hypothetical protein [Caudoviricetes sp.]
MQDNNKTPLDQIAENYQVQEGTEHLYHVALWMEEYDPKTGKPVHTPTTDVFGVQTFERNVSNFKKLGYTLKVLHDPREFLKNQAEQAAARAEQEEQDKIKRALQKQREEFEKTRQADIEQAVNKALAERDKQAEQSEKPKKQEK